MKEGKPIMQGTLRNVPVAELTPDPDQPRQDFKTLQMEQLKESIRDRGIMTPIAVEPKRNGEYLIVDGERRYRSAVALKLKNVPVNVLPEALSASDRNIVRFQLQETHSAWSPFEKAQAMKNIKEALELTSQELAQSLAIAKVTCDRYISILSLSPKVRKQISDVKLPFAHIESIASMLKILPSVIRRDVKDPVKVIISKYQKGLLTNHNDLRLINRLIKAGENKQVKKFLTDEKYTATNAYMDSSAPISQFQFTMGGRAKMLMKDLKIIQVNDVKLSEETLSTIYRLKDALNKASLG